jgi:predicted MFS family arabinose efflux permease
MPAQKQHHGGTVLGLLKRRHVRIAMLAAMLTFAGAFCTFTYLRPFLEAYLRVSASQLSLLLLGLGLAGFVGTFGAGALLKTHLYPLLRWLPLALGVVTVILLGVGHRMAEVAIAMIAWGALNSAIPVAWSTWLSKGVSDDPESGGGLMVAAIQLSIMLGAASGGTLLDHIAIGAPFLGGAIFLVLAAILIGTGERITPVSPRPRARAADQSHYNTRGSYENSPDIRPQVSHSQVE